MAVDMIARQMAMDAAAGGGVDPDDAYTKAQTDVLLSGKVDKEAGKGLSTNDYTSAEKEKLAGIGEGAEANVNADWEAESGDAQILHKPTLGTAAAADTTTSIASGGTGLPTAGTVYTDQQRQDAAIAECVDDGAKNFATVSSGTNSTDRFAVIPLSAPAGTYYLSIGELTSDDTDSATCYFAVDNSSGTAVSSIFQLSRGRNIVQKVVLTGTAARMRLYPSDNSAHSDGDTVTFTNLMFCSETDWNASQKFVLYAPTNRELYEDKINLDDVFGEGETIAANSDLDNCGMGLHRCATSQVAGTLSHCPTSSAFKLETRYTASAGRYVQMLYTNAALPDIYYRTYTANGWSSWYNLATTEEVFGFPLEVQNATDLNTVTTPGRYRRGNYYASTPNCPTPFAFSMEVRKTSGVALEQILYETNQLAGVCPAIFRRVYSQSAYESTGGWSPWYKFVGTEVT